MNYVSKQGSETDTQVWEMRCIKNRTLQRVINVIGGHLSKCNNTHSKEAKVALSQDDCDIQ